jgi:hypothetical protein
MGQETSLQGMLGMIAWISSHLLNFINFQTPEEGSRTIVYAALSPALEGKGGNYLSNCTETRMHPKARSPMECKKLFAYSCELLKIENFGFLEKN